MTVIGYWPCDCYDCRNDANGPKMLTLTAPRHGVDPDPPRCWSCGHPFDAGCECTCCYDDHSEEPSPHD